MKEIRTEIVIEAPRDRVWEVLTDFAGYPQWNPFIVHIAGPQQVGAQLRTTMRQGGKDNHFKPKVMVWEPETKFEWLGKLPLGAFSGHHYFHLESVGENRTKLVHGERFGGWLRGMIMKKIGEQTRQSFIEMNRALSEEAIRRTT